MRCKKAEAVVAGHICLDIIPQIVRREGGLKALLAPGKLVDVGPATLSTGGAVSNTGLALHRLGLPTRLMGKIGDDGLGQTILELLRRQGKHNWDPAWSPEGTEIVFISDTSGATEVWAISVEGGQPHQLTSDGAEKRFPLWSIH